MAKLISKELEPGKYWIGDLCYVMHPEWDEICNIICNRSYNGQTPVIELDDGRTVGLSFTAYGDGVYRDQYSREYGVDAGLIGVIKLEDILGDEAENISLGHVQDFERPFNIGYRNGVINFGPISINTGAYDYDDYDD